MDKMVAIGRETNRSISGDGQAGLPEQRHPFVLIRPSQDRQGRGPRILGCCAADGHPGFVFDKEQNGSVGDGIDGDGDGGQFAGRIRRGGV